MTQSSTQNRNDDLRDMARDWAKVLMEAENESCAVIVEAFAEQATADDIKHVLGCCAAAIRTRAAAK